MARELNGAIRALDKGAQAQRRFAPVSGEIKLSPCEIAEREHVGLRNVSGDHDISGVRLRAQIATTPSCCDEIEKQQKKSPARAGLFAS
jgi:hypothetical protein